MIWAGWPISSLSERPSRRQNSVLTSSKRCARVKAMPVGAACITEESFFST